MRMWFDIVFYLLEIIRFPIRVIFACASLDRKWHQNLLAITAAWGLPVGSLRTVRVRGHKNRNLLKKKQKPEPNRIEADQTGFSP